MVTFVLGAQRTDTTGRGGRALLPGADEKPFHKVSWIDYQYSLSFDAFFSFFHWPSPTRDLKITACK